MPDSLVLEPRVTGKTKFARDLRKAGLIPGVLYGRGAEPVSFQVDVPSLRAALSGEAGRHAVLKLKVPGRKGDTDRKSTRLNSSHLRLSRMPSSA